MSASRLEAPGKLVTEEEMVARLRSGMTIGIGGWGSRRKPMSFVRALLRSDLTDLTLVSCGGADVGMLCAAGKVRRLIAAFVTLDGIPLEAHYRQARESGALEVEEHDEGMFLLGLQAAAWRVPFLPTRAGLGSDIFRLNPRLRTVTSPYPAPDGSGEELVAVPALELDAAVVHVNQADERGNGRITDVDPFFDALFLGAAAQRFVTAETVVPSGQLAADGDYRSLEISRHLVDAVAHAPRGAHPGACLPDYEADWPFLKAYSAAAPDGWPAFAADWISLDEKGYRAWLDRRSSSSTPAR